MKKLSILITAILISTSMLAGCGKKEVPKEEHKLSNDSANSQIINNIKDGQKDNLDKGTVGSGTKEEETIDKKVPVLEKYTLSPSVDSTKVTPEEKFDWQMQMNALGSMYPGVVDFKVISAKYESDGSITAMGAIRNATGKVVFEVGIPVKLRTPEDKIIATGNFYASQKECGDIADGNTLLIPIKFKAEDVKLKNIDLTKTLVQHEAHYFQK
jgi:SLAP domain-containing protein